MYDLMFIFTSAFTSGPVDRVPVFESVTALSGSGTLLFFPRDIY